MPYALCPMPYALCPMPEAYLIFLRKAIDITIEQFGHKPPDSLVQSKISNLKLHDSPPSQS